MQTSKELLSQNEIKALLDVLSTSSKENDPSTLSFEWRMAKVTNSVKSYLDGFALPVDEVIVSKEKTLVADAYVYQTDYPYLESLRLENSLALAIIASRFGAEREQSFARELSSLEKYLLEDVCKEIVYIVEKELDVWFIDADEVLSYRELSFYKNSVLGRLGFEFRNEIVQDEVYANKTVVEAIVGSLNVETIKTGVRYKVKGFMHKSIILMFDKTLCYKALKSSRDSASLSYVLQDALTVTTPFPSFYLVVGSSVLEDDAYLSLSKGSVLKLSRFVEAEIHKDGKLIAKAKLQLTNSEMIVEII